MKYTLTERYLIQVSRKAFKLSDKQIKIKNGFWSPPDLDFWHPIDSLPLNNEEELINIFRKAKNA